MGKENGTVGVSGAEGESIQDSPDTLVRRSNEIQAERNRIAVSLKEDESELRVLKEKMM